MSVVDRPHTDYCAKSPVYGKHSVGRVKPMQLSATHRVPTFVGDGVGKHSPNQR